MTTYIWHVTLNTGHGVRQVRDGVTDATISIASELIDAIVAGGHPPIPALPDYLIAGSARGDNLSATIFRGPWETRTPIITIGVALKSRSAPAMWRMLHETATSALATDSDDPPRAPWIADRLEPGAIRHAAALAWTGDFSRSLAWTWAERRASRH